MPSLSARRLGHKTLSLEGEEQHPGAKATWAERRSAGRPDSLPGAGGDAEEGRRGGTVCPGSTLANVRPAAGRTDLRERLASFTRKKGITKGKHPAADALLSHFREACVCVAGAFSEAVDQYQWRQTKTVPTNLEPAKTERRGWLAPGAFADLIKSPPDSHPEPPHDSNSHFHQDGNGASQMPSFRPALATQCPPPSQHLR